MTQRLKKRKVNLTDKPNFIKKILVALDGSEPADKALDFALDLAEKYSAEVALLSVAHMPLVVYTSPGIGGFPPVAIGRYTKKLKASHEKLLSEALKRAKKVKPNLKVSTKLLEGRPSDKIIETAKEGNFDIIVMGSRGLGGIKEFFLGSVSDRVADEAVCPVLIVK
jgi:nucleotide-binding universal stress UspA family protein